MNQFFGGCLMAVGILIAGTAGLCSLWVLSMGGGFDGGGLVLLFGGVPLAVGVLMIIGGRGLLKNDDEDRWR